jgi:hypothetical protein
MKMLVCPVCSTEYEDWSTKCLNCGVALVAVGDPLDPLSLPEEEQVIYEVGAWPLDVQATVAQVMAESGIPHAWDGTDLVVHLDDEAQVDTLLEDVEREAGLATADEGGAGGSEAPGEDGDGAVLGEDGDEGSLGELLYELNEWADHERERLTGALRDAGIPFRWEGATTLVVADHDEERVEAVLDEVEFPDALAVEDRPPGGEDVEARAELLSELFLAADRLKSNPLDSQGVAMLRDAVEEADAAVPPYGFDRQVWSVLVERANELVELINDNDTTVEDAEEHAQALRDLLRPYV